MTNAYFVSLVGEVTGDSVVIAPTTKDPVPESPTPAGTVNTMHYRLHQCKAHFTSVLLVRYATMPFMSVNI